MSAQSLQPFDYNLLELYHQHREEIEALTDETSLFILAFTNQLERAQIDELAGDLGISMSALQLHLEPLLRGALMRQREETLTVTALGKRVLEETGFLTTPLVLSTMPNELPSPAAETPVSIAADAPGWLWGIIAFLLTAAIALVLILILAVMLLPKILNP